MSDTTPPFAFSQFVPGFDFLKNLAGASPLGAGGGAGPGAAPGMPSLSSWVAPTLSVEEVDKRIQELKTVQYWLEQNGHALQATIQALEVQKMTLSTLRGMNLQMEDLAKVFTRAATPAEGAGAPPPTARATQAEASTERTAAPSSDPTDPADKPVDAVGVVDPMQWWNALTQQFQQIAASAMQDAADIKMPAMTPPFASAAAPKKKASAAKAAATQNKPAAPASRKTAAAPRKRSR
jgi:hypothetical protein